MNNLLAIENVLTKIKQHYTGCPENVDQNSVLISTKCVFFYFF